MKNLDCLRTGAHQRARGEREESKRRKGHIGPNAARRLRRRGTAFFESSRLAKIAVRLRAAGTGRQPALCCRGGTYRAPGVLSKDLSTWHLAGMCPVPPWQCGTLLQREPPLSLPYSNISTRHAGQSTAYSSCLPDLLSLRLPVPDRPLAALRATHVCLSGGTAKPRPACAVFRAGSTVGE